MRRDNYILLDTSDVITFFIVLASVFCSMALLRELIFDVNA